MTNKFRDICDNLLEEEIDYTTKMYLDDVDTFNLFDNNDTNDKLILEIREIVRKLNLFFFSMGYDDQKFYRMSLLDKIDICLNECTNSKDIEILSGLSKQFLECRNRLVSNNLDMVLEIAKNYLIKDSFGIDIDELIQAGNIGLIKCIDDYCYAKSFNQYAKMMIDFSINLYAFENKLNFSVSKRVFKECYKINKAMYDLYSKLGRYPNNIELSKYLDIPVTRIIKMKKFIELNDCVDMINFVPSMDKDMDGILIDLENIKEISELFEGLTEKESFILKYKYGFNDGYVYSDKQISDIFGVSTQRINVIKNTALKRMRAGILRKTRGIK